MTVDTLGRAYQLYRRTATSRTAILLLLANLVPLAGVLFFGWSLLTILVLYWVENGIVGLWNVPKILLAQGSMLPRLPDLPPDAALAATRSAAEAAALQGQWRKAQAAQAALAAGTPTRIEVQTESGTRLLGPQAAARFGSMPRIGLAIFFAFHYGMFWLVHGIFVFALPAFAGGVGSTTSVGGLDGSQLCFDPSGYPIACPAGGFGDVVWSSVLIGAIALFLSHGASFFLNYLGRGEYLTATPAGQMAGVYGRVVILHLTIILGSLVVAFLGSPLGALLVLVGLKTAFDLGLHLRERRKAASPFDGAALAPPPSAV